MTLAATAAPASAQAPKEVSQEPEYDFTDIISANGVLEVLSDGYVSFAAAISTISHLQMIST